MTKAGSELPNDLKAEISDFKRRRIKEEACALFFEQGYESTTLDAVAKRLDITKPYIYGHYGSKSDLLYEICRTGIAHSLDAMEKACALQRPVPERLQVLVESVLGIIFEYQKFIVVYEREEKNLDPARAREIRDLRNLFDHQLAKLLEEGHDSGVFEVVDPVLTATTIGGIITWVAFWYSPTGRRTQIEITNHILSMIDAVVHNQSASSRKRPSVSPISAVKSVSEKSASNHE